jgi:3-hydroxyacyl-CoA dehydrogenase
MEKAFPERMKPSPLLHRLENTGRLGRKSGLGFYRYERGERKGPDETLREEIGLASAAADAEATVYDDDYLVSRTLYPMVNEAARALADGVVATPGDGDLALVLGIGWPPFRGGLMRWADGAGLERIADRLAEWAAALGPRFEPSDALRERSRRDGGFYGRPSGAPPEEQPTLQGF